MADVEVRDILLRCGGRTLHRTGYLCAMGAGRGYVEVKETFARADASTCASFVDRDVGAGQLVRLAEAGKVRIEYPPALSGLVDQFGYPYCGPILEGTRQQLIQNSDYEVDIVGSVVKGGSTLVRDNAHVFRGSWALKMTVANAATSGVSFTKRDGSRMVGVAGTTYAGSAWVYATGAAVGGNLRIFVDWFDGASAYLSTGNCGAQITLVQGWQRIGGFGALAPANAVTAIPYLVTNTGSGIWDAWVDVPQWEVGAFSSSAIPTGTVELTRAADSLTLPFNFGPMDISVLARIARPVWADVVGAIGLFPGAASISSAISRLRVQSDSTVRQWYANPDTPASSPSSTAAIIAGTPMNLCAQFRQLTTAPKGKMDAGAGFAGESGAATAFAAFGDQTLRVGSCGAGAELNGVLLDLIFVRGLHTLAEMLAIP